MPETALLFFLLYVLGLAAALFIGPIWGMYTYIAVFYLHPPARWWGEALPDIRWSLVAALVTLVAIQIHRGGQGDRPPWYGSTIAKCLILYTLLMWVQIPFAYSPWHMSGVVLFTKYLILFYLMHNIIDNEKRIEDFLFANVVGCAYFGFLIYLAPDGGRFEGIGGPGVNDANTLGMHLSAVLMFASFLLLSLKDWRRWAILVFLPIIINGIIQTESRGAIVGLLIGCFASLYLKPKKIRKIYYALATVAVISSLGLFNQAFLERMTTSLSAASGEIEWDGSASSRIAIVKAQMQMIKDYPQGAGHQGTTALSRSYLDESLMAKTTGDRASHNTFMSVVVDQGILGAIIFIVIAFSVLRLARRLKAADAQGLSLGLGLSRAAIFSALAVSIGAGMFTDYLKAEVQIWNLILITLLWEFANRELSGTSREVSTAAVPGDRLYQS